MKIPKTEQYYACRFWVLVLSISFLPVFLWFESPTSLPRFSNFAISMSNIGQIFALTGTVIFSLNLLLSTRLKFLEKYVNGLNNLYNKHSRLGQIAFILLLFHPIFLIQKYAGRSFSQAAVFLFPSSNWAQNWGLFSLGLMILLIILTLYLRPKYNIWKWTHKFFGFAFFLAALHIWFIPSDISRYMPLRIYMLSLVVIGLIAFIYRTLFGRILVKKLKYIVIDVNQLNSDIVEITMKSQDESLQYFPGQFVFLSFADDNISSEAHPFSISSSNENYLTITVKMLGDYTKNMSKISINSVVEIEGPFGVFSYHNALYKKQIWVAGGIGITPFLSMIKLLNDDYDIYLYYCVKNETEAVYLNFLNRISAYSNNSLKIILFYSEQYGHINADFIQKSSNGIDNKDIFICAPISMIRSLSMQFIARGVNKRLIHSEEFRF